MGNQRALVDRVAARYKQKKKVKSQDGGETTVYLYSERQVADRNRKKAERIEKLRKSIDKLRKQVSKDLTSKDPKKRALALAVGLMDHTYERIGNDASAKEGHFGVTTWKIDQVKYTGKTATITYVGKSGVKHTKKVTDPKLVAAMKGACEGREKNCKIVDATATEVNKYLKPFDITAKDIRGFHANEEMKRQLRQVRKGKLPEDKKEKEKKLKEEFKKALEAAAEAVGHEPSTLKSQYLVPGLEDEYLKDGSISEKLIKKSFYRMASQGTSMEGRIYMAAQTAPTLVAWPRDVWKALAPNFLRWASQTQNSRVTPRIEGMSFPEHMFAVLWYEDRAGNRIEDPSTDRPDGPYFPFNAHTQHAQFPNELRESVLVLNPDGTSTPLLEATSTYPSDILTAMIRSGDWDAADAIMVLGKSCERCLNVLANRYRDNDGYPYGSEEYWKAGTRCIMCEHVDNAEEAQYRQATKTPAEKEDKKVEKMLRKEPKKKPPRYDLRNNRTLEEDDPDLDGLGAGDKGDPDLSLNYKKLAFMWLAIPQKPSASRVALWKLAETSQVTPPPPSPSGAQQTAPRKSGDVWETPHGNWRGMNDQGTQKSFRQRQEAENFAKGRHADFGARVESPADVKVGDVLVSKGKSGAHVTMQVVSHEGDTFQVKLYDVETGRAEGKAHNVTADKLTKVDTRVLSRQEAAEEVEEPEEAPEAPSAETKPKKPGKTKRYQDKIKELTRQRKKLEKEISKLEKQKEQGSAPMDEDKAREEIDKHEDAIVETEDAIEEATKRKKEHEKELKPLQEQLKQYKEMQEKAGQPETAQKLKEIVLELAKEIQKGKKEIVDAKAEIDHQRTKRKEHQKAIKGIKKQLEEPASSDDLDAQIAERKGKIEDLDSTIGDYKGLLEAQEAQPEPAPESQAPPQAPEPQAPPATGEPSEPELKLPPRPPPSPEEKAEEEKQEKARQEKSKAKEIQKSIKEAQETLKSILGDESDFPADYKKQIEMALSEMEDGDLARFTTALQEQSDQLKHLDPESKQATELANAAVDFEDYDRLRDPAELGKAVAGIAWARSHVANPMALGGDPIGGVDLVDAQYRQGRARQGYRQFKNLDSRLREHAAARLMHAMRGLPEKSKRRQEMDAILTGINMAHVIDTGHALPGRPQPSKGNVALMKKLADLGHAEMMFEPSKDFFSEDSLRVMHDALTRMKPRDVGEIVTFGNPQHPYAQLRPMLQDPSVSREYREFLKSYLIRDYLSDHWGDRLVRDVMTASGHLDADSPEVRNAEIMQAKQQAMPGMEKALQAMADASESMSQGKRPTQEQQGFIERYFTVDGIRENARRLLDHLTGKFRKVPQTSPAGAVLRDFAETGNVEGLTQEVRPGPEAYHEEVTQRMPDHGNGERDKERHSGEVWKTEAGNWRAKNKQGVPKTFPAQDEADRWAHGPPYDEKSIEKEQQRRQKQRESEQAKTVPRRRRPPETQDEQKEMESELKDFVQSQQKKEGWSDEKADKFFEQARKLLSDPEKRKKWLAQRRKQRPGKKAPEGPPSRPELEPEGFTGDLGDFEERGPTRWASVRRVALLHRVAETFIQISWDDGDIPMSRIVPADSLKYIFDDPNPDGSGTVADSIQDAMQEAMSRRVAFQWTAVRPKPSAPRVAFQYKSAAPN